MGFYPTTKLPVLSHMCRIMELQQLNLILFIILFECLKVAALKTSERRADTLIKKEKDFHIPFQLRSLTPSVRWGTDMSPDSFSKLLQIVYSASPPHDLYLLYENGYGEYLSALTALGASFKPSTVVKFSSDIQSRISTLLAPSSSSTVRRNILVLCSLGNIFKIFEMISVKKLESPSLWWILVLKAQDPLQVLQETVREGSQVIIIQPNSVGSVQILSSSVNGSGIVNFKKTATWAQNSPGNHSEVFGEIFFDLDTVYSNFGGRHIKVTANNDPPFMIVHNEGNGKYSVSGFEAQILHGLANTLNFTYEVAPSPDGRWGGPTGNGTVIGTIGVVHRRESLFSINEFTVTGKREEVIDFTYPYYVESLSLVSRAPREKNKALAVFTPFTPDVWLYIALSTIIMGFIVAYQKWILTSFFFNNSRTYSLKNILFNVYRSLVKQENLLIPLHWSFKFNFVLWYLFVFIISVLYSGMLTSTLVKPSFEKPINSLADLPNAISNGYTLVVTGESSLEYLFKYATVGIYADTWKLFNHKNRSKSFPRSSSAKFDRILPDKLIIIKSKIEVTYDSAERGADQYYVAKETFSPQFYAMACFPGAPFLSKFSKLLSYMDEGGLIAKWLDEEFVKIGGIKSYDTETGSRAFTLEQLQASFYIVLLGYGLASLCFVTEISIYAFGFKK